MVQPAVHLERQCECQDRLGMVKRLPLRRHAANAQELIDAIPALVGFASLRLIDYRCPKCKATIGLTLRDLLGEGLSLAS